MKSILQVRKQLVLHKNAIILHDIFARTSRFYIIYHYDVAMHFGIMNEHYLLRNELNDLGDIILINRNIYFLYMIISSKCFLLIHLFSIYLHTCLKYQQNFIAVSSKCYQNMQKTILVVKHNPPFLTRG